MKKRKITLGHLRDENGRKIRVDNPFKTVEEERAFREAVKQVGENLRTAFNKFPIFPPQDESN